MMRGQGMEWTNDEDSVEGIEWVAIGGGVGGASTGCFTEKVWQNNGVGVTELQFPFPEGWIKGQADGDNEYVIVSYNTVPRHVAISLGSKKNPSI